MLVAISIFSVVVYSICNPRHFECPACTRLVDSHIAWSCGACGHENEENTFEQKCAKCRRFPENVACHHCNTPFSTVDKPVNTNQITRILPRPLAGETPEQSAIRYAKEVAAREHANRLLSLEAEIKAKEKRIAELSTGPRDEATARQEVFLKELAALRFSVKSIDMAKTEEARLLREIESNQLDEEQREECKKLLRLRVIDLCERLRAGPIQM